MKNKRSLWGVDTATVALHERLAKEMATQNNSNVNKKVLYKVLFYFYFLYDACNDLNKYYIIVMVII